MLGDKLTISDNNRKIVYNQCNPLKNQLENILLITSSHVIMSIETTRSSVVSIEFYYYITNTIITTTPPPTCKSFFFLNLIQ